MSHFEDMKLLKRAKPYIQDIFIVGEEGKIMGNDTKAFDFAFKDPTRKFTVNPDELQYASDYEEDMENLEDKTPVVVFTRNHRIEGKIALVPGARLTDYVVGAHQFIAMTKVTVKDISGKILLNSPFLDVNRDQIEIIFPSDLATFHEG